MRCAARLPSTWRNACGAMSDIRFVPSPWSRLLPVLFPLAGLDPARAEEYARVRSLVDRLSYAGNEAARAYLNGVIDADSAAAWINAYALMEPARAEQRVRFIDTYRSYVINYNYGRDLVGDYVERRGGTVDSPARRWEVFKELLSTPRLPSDLR